MQKDKFLSYLQELKKLVSKADFEINLIDSLQKKIEELELIVPVVGGFSAGKSSLINSFLDGEILPVKITPETALSTELRYSKKNYIEAVKKDNTIENFDISSMSEIKNSAKDYRYIKLYLNNQNLKDIEPLILVDMPGFDSPIELHNQAIMNYLNMGVSFIILNSIEDGTISKSILREIDNIVGFDKDFTFCISKTDLKPDDIIKEVKDIMQEQLEVEFDYSKDIVLLDDKGGLNLNKILKNIDIDNLYKRLFLEELKSNYFQIESTFNTTIYSLKTTNEKIEDSINELKESINKLLSKKEELINKTKERYSKKGVNKIIDAIVIELLNNQEHLINLALNNQELFSNEVNNIVKNKLIYEIKSNLDDISSDIINNFELEISTTNLSSFDIDGKQIAQNIKTTLNITQNSLENISKLTKDKNNTIYKTVTTILGLTTTIINPLLEIMIVFLPEIIDFFTRESREEKARNELINKFHTQIIPTIKSKLSVKLEELMRIKISELIVTISSKFEEQLRIKENELQNTIEEKQKNQQNIEEKIEFLEDIKLQIQTISNDKIFK